MKQIKDDEFQKEVLTNGLVVVDFYGTFCGPCKILAPRLEELAEQNKEVKIIKMDIEESPETPANFGIRGVPTLLFFKNGTLVHQFVGLKSKEDIQKIIDSYSKIEKININEDF